jgi:Kef-type K+ transport system membrane component KefB
MSGLLDQLVNYKSLFIYNPVFGAGILLVAGWLIGNIVAKIKLPHITGYIIAGILVGDSVLGVFPHQTGKGFSIITEIALGIIAVTIGGEFYWGKFKRTGKDIFIITIVQLFATFIAVTVVLRLLSFPLHFSMMLGAIASATAPAATVAIVQNLRCRGKFVDYLFGIVALDDAGCIILFGVVFAFAVNLSGAGGVDASSFSIVLHSISEVGFSIVAGVVFGFLMHYLIAGRNQTGEILIIFLGILFLSVAISVSLELSPLLVNMAAGAVLINMSPANNRIFRAVLPITPPLYALFFVIAGTELKLEVLLDKNILILGAGYIIARALGKYYGVKAGCMISKTDDNMKKYLGLCMIPQAGVAIGLVLLIQSSPQIQNLSGEQAVFVSSMVNIVLLSVFINELIGPPLSHLALVKGSEIDNCGRR